MATTSTTFQTELLNTIHAACLERGWNAGIWNQASAEEWGEPFVADDELVFLDFGDVRLMIGVRGDMVRITSASHFWMSWSEIGNYERHLNECLDEVQEQAQGLADGSIWEDAV